MKSLWFVGFSAILSLTVGCAAETSPSETGSNTNAVVGLANPAAVHCESLGFDIVGDRCVFGDGTSCEQWAFFRGECKAPDPKPDTGPGPLCKPLEQPGGGASPGLANPATVYCEALGYTASGETCIFPDNTSCEQWAFFRGECGAAHSFCARNGGQVANKTETVGSSTASYAVCSLRGNECKEQTFAATCECK